MLAQVLKLRTIVVPVLLCAFVVALTSCATQKETALVRIRTIIMIPRSHGTNRNHGKQAGSSRP